VPAGDSPCSGSGNSRRGSASRSGTRAPGGRPPRGASEDRTAAPGGRRARRRSRAVGDHLQDGGGLLDLARPRNDLDERRGTAEALEQRASDAWGTPEAGGRTACDGVHQGFKPESKASSLGGIIVSSVPGGRADPAAPRHTRLCAAISPRNRSLGRLAPHPRAPKKGLCRLDRTEHEKVVAAHEDGRAWSAAPHEALSRWSRMVLTEGWSFHVENGSIVGMNSTDRPNLFGVRNSSRAVVVPTTRRSAARMFRNFTHDAPKRTESPEISDRAGGDTPAAAPDIARTGPAPPQPRARRRAPRSVG